MVHSAYRGKASPALVDDAVVKMFFARDTDGGMWLTFLAGMPSVNMGKLIVDVKFSGTLGSVELAHIDHDPMGKTKWNSGGPNS